MDPTKKHLLVKATIAEATDLGEFTAIISTVSVDRDGDVVEPAAVVAALQKWAPLGKRLPLSWGHEYDAEYIIGWIDPGSVYEQDGEVVAGGWIDQSTDRGKHAWRLVRSGVLGFSYGFLVPDGGARPRGDGGKGLHITQLDIFEVTATPIPANAETRVLSFKSVADLKKAMDDLEREQEEAQLPDVEDPPPPPPPEPAPPPAPVAPDAEALKATATEIEREEEERQLPKVDPPPPPPPSPPPPPPAPPPDTETLKAAAAAIEREEEERRLPQVDAPPAPPEPRPAPPPPPPPDAKALKAAADAIEREEAERRIPAVDPPPPEPKPAPPAPPPPPPDSKVLRRAAALIEREEQERQLPKVEVVEAEPVPEEGWAAELHEMWSKGVTDGDLLAFSRRVISELGGTSLEALETQVKRLEREEHSLKEAAIVKSAELEGQIAEAKEAVVALELFEPSEVEGMKSGELKAVWTTAYINDLPDSAFLHIESGGSKDSDGKTTPRSLRHFPYKSASGTIDLPHLRNALARIPQSSLPQNVKDRLAQRAQRILDNAKTVDVTGKEKDPPGGGSRSVDSLRKQSDDVALEHFSDGLDRRKPPTQVEPPKPQPELDLKALKERMFEETLTLLSE